MIAGLLGCICSGMANFSFRVWSFHPPLFCFSFFLFFTLGTVIMWVIDLDEQFGICWAMLAMITVDCVMVLLIHVSYGYLGLWIVVDIWDCFFVFIWVVCFVFLVLWALFFFDFVFVQCFCFVLVMYVFVPFLVF